MKLNIEGLLQTVPMIPIKGITDNTVHALMEKYNITGSVKVKPVYRIFKDAYEKGLLDENKIILEASSGNTAIALAYLGNLFALQVQIILPRSTSPCKKKLIQFYGAEIIEIDGPTDMGIKLRDHMHAENPGKYFLPDQFGNYANFRAHYHLTGPYILKKLGKIDFFIAGLGTSGTLLGAGEYLKEHLPDIKIIGINPLDRIEGLRNFKTTDIVIPFFEEHKGLIDEIIDVTFDPCVISGIQDYLKEGYFVGISSGAILSGAKKYLHGKSGLKGVIVAPDGGDYYLDTLVKYLDAEDFVACK